MIAIRHLNIEITRRCDQRCVYCFNDSGPGARFPELTLEAWVSFVRLAQRRGLRGLHVTGGEPFISPNTVPLLQEAQSLGVPTSVLSNGLRIPGVARDEPALLRRLSVAQISLDSMDASEHDTRRGRKGAWKQAVLAIEALRQLDVPIEVSCTVDVENHASVGDVARFCRRVGALLIVRPVVGLGRARGSARNRAAHSQAAQRLVDQHSDILVCDRFAYVPNSATGDTHAVASGIMTVLPDGRFRSGRVALPGSGEVSTAAEYVEAA